MLNGDLFKDDQTPDFNDLEKCCKKDQQNLIEALF
jgi:hypothetical protein